MRCVAWMCCGCCCEVGGKEKECRGSCTICLELEAVQEKVRQGLMLIQERFGPNSVVRTRAKRVDRSHAVADDAMMSCMARL